MIDTTTCVVCGRVMQRSTKPVWMATPEGVITGLAHTGCSWPADRRLKYVASKHIPLEAARFKAWFDTRPERMPQIAILVGTEAPQDTPSAEQRRLLDYWETHGTPIMGVNAEAAWGIYTALVAEFRRWCETA